MCQAMQAISRCSHQATRAEESSDCCGIWTESSGARQRRSEAADQICNAASAAPGGCGRLAAFRLSLRKPWSNRRKAGAPMLANCLQRQQRVVSKVTNRVPSAGRARSVGNRVLAWGDGNAFRLAMSHTSMRACVTRSRHQNSRVFPVCTCQGRCEIQPSPADALLGTQGPRMAGFRDAGRAQRRWRGGELKLESEHQLSNRPGQLLVL
jgi:hypothetical protein